MSLSEFESRMIKIEQKRNDILKSIHEVLLAAYRKDYMKEEEECSKDESTSST